MMEKLSRYVTRRHRLALPILDPCSRRGLAVRAKPRPLYPRKTNLRQEDEWATGAVWAEAGNPTPSRFRNQGHPARSESLY